VLAEDLVVDTQRRVTVATELARTTADPRRDRDAVAGGEPIDTVADRPDDTGSVTTGDVWQVEVDAWDSPATPHVEVIQRAGLDIDEHFVPVHGWVGTGTVLDDPSTAVFGEPYCIHD
jgi:hypothetical protein